MDEYYLDEYCKQVERENNVRCADFRYQYGIRELQKRSKITINKR